MDDAQITLTRRRAIQAGGAVTAALLLELHTGRAFAASPALSLTSDAGAPGYLRRSTYAGLSGSDFTAVGDSATLALAAVDDLDDPSLTGADDAFRLALVASGSDPLAQGVYTLSHPEIGQFDAFVVPVGPGGSTTTYEMIVNRSVIVPNMDGPPAAPQQSATAGGSTPAGPASVAGGSPAASSTGAAVTATAVPTPSPRHPGASQALTRRVTVRRHAHGAEVDVVLAQGPAVRSLYVRLRRGAHHYSARTNDVNGARTRVLLPATHRLAAGRYELTITVVRFDGGVATADLAVTLP